MRRAPCTFLALLMALLSMLISDTGCKTKVAPKPPETKIETKTPQGPATQPPVAPKISLKASPSAIEMGQTTELSWDSSNATGVTIDNGIGTVEASGSRTISPKTSTTYKAVATGPSATAAAEVRVTVTPPPPEVPKLPPEGNPIDVVQGDIKDVFFDYDQYTIREDARTALLADVRLLAKYPGIRITIEGHCDERGSEKYNLALGDRRAMAVKDFLTAQGVAGSRIDTISYGKERPFCEERNEECWQLNRRGHFMIR
jgi:peptidoglycan-associated lipoprotein